LHNCAIKKDSVVFAAVNILKSKVPFRRSRPGRPTNLAHAGRDVSAALALKAVLLFAIYLLFFGPAHRSPSDAAATANALIGTSTPKDAP
jgi:hypothetical protein